MFYVKIKDTIKCGTLSECREWALDHIETDPSCTIYITKELFSPPVLEITYDGWRPLEPLLSHAHFTEVVDCFYDCQDDC